MRGSRAYRAKIQRTREVQREAGRQQSQAQLQRSTPPLFPPHPGAKAHRGPQAGDLDRGERTQPPARVAAQELQADADHRVADQPEPEKVARRESSRP